MRSPLRVDVAPTTAPLMPGAEVRTIAGLLESVGGLLADVSIAVADEVVDQRELGPLAARLDEINALTFNLRRQLYARRVR